jgi:hypothetical protein
MLCCALLLALCLSAAPPPTEWQPALDRISAASLRGHLSFLASDLLEGRKTPRAGSIRPPSTSPRNSAAGLKPGDLGHVSRIS